MQAALNDYGKHKYASSAWGPRSSVERTWRDYHAKVYKLEQLLAPGLSKQV